VATLARVARGRRARAEAIDGTRTWPLTDIPTSSNDGIISPRFNRASPALGTEIVWAQMYGVLGSAIRLASGR
jgi:hypothetical protein